MSERALQVIITIMDGGPQKATGKESRPMRIDALWLAGGGEPQPCTDVAAVVKALDAALKVTVSSIQIDFPAVIALASGGGLDA